MNELQVVLRALAEAFQQLDMARGVISDLRARIAQLEEVPGADPGTPQELDRAGA